MGAHSRRAPRRGRRIVSHLFVGAGGAVAALGVPAVIATAAPMSTVEVAAPAVSAPVTLPPAPLTPCDVRAAGYADALGQAAAGSLTATDDAAVIAALLIAECGWTPLDATLGGTA